MALLRSWEDRIKRCIEILPQTLTREIAEVDLSGFTTMEHLHPDEARKRSFKPMRAGDTWGRTWEYGWFKAVIEAPAAAKGKRLVLRCIPGTEGYAMVNGQYVGSVGTAEFGPVRAFVELTRSAKAGEKFDVLIEAYAGHGPTPVTSIFVNGALPAANVPHSSPEPRQTLPRATLEIWNEETYQAYTDMRTLWELRNALPPESLHRAEIEAALQRVSTTLDFALPHEPFAETVRQSREIMRPQLECRNGTIAHEFFCIGHGHLDLAWLWPLQETHRKVVRTLSNQFALAREYPEHKFLQSQAYLYWYAKQKYPEFYETMKEMVRSGHLIADGAMWVEADLNVSSGESIVRQFVHAARFFKEEFGVESTVCWLPDAFGFCGSLPQIMRGCGAKYFSTQKVYWGYNGAEIFPHGEFVWEGIDGSEVLATLYFNYNSGTSPGYMIGHSKGWKQFEGLPVRLQPFGHGDGGGGPDRDHLEFLRRGRDLQDSPRARIAPPSEYFADLEKRGGPKEHYVGELFVPVHLGTYTSQARTKRGNRLAEWTLREAELWGAAALALKDRPYPLEQMDAAWKVLLLHQFHDILPGSSIQRVYQETEKALAEIIGTAQEQAGQAMAALTPKSASAVTVFNSLSWQRSALVALPKEMGQAQGLPVQEIEGTAHAEVAVPACGWTTVRKGASSSAKNALKAETKLLENEHLRLEFNERGEITRVFDKDADRELAAGVCNEMAMFKDTPAMYSAWDIDLSYKEMPVELPEPARVEVVATGPLVAILRVRRRINQSEMVQDISLRRGSRRVDFKTTIDWQETEKLLKVRFPVSVHSDTALSEIQFGHIARPTHASRPHDRDRYEVSQQKWTALVESARGAAVLNDCKYGISVERNSINLTLLRSTTAPDPAADRGKQEFTYAFYAWDGPFIESRLVQEAYELNIPVLTCAGDGGEKSLFSLDVPNIIVETVKPAEDGSGDVIVRLYEAYRTATRCRLRVNMPVRMAHETNMLEEQGVALAINDGGIVLDFRPFEIKTIRLKR